MSTTYPLPENETERLRVVEEARVYAAAVASFDDLTALAADICDAPLAFLTLIEEERQWVMASFGVEIQETSREISFCTHAICQPGIFIVPDALADARFAHNPLVTAAPSIRFYAGVPLITSEGHAVGTLCVLDRVPRELSASQKRALRVLSHHVGTQLELRRAEARRRQAEEELAQLNARLEELVRERTGQYEAEHKVTEAIIGSLPGLFYFFDEQGHYLRWNADAERVTGLYHGAYGRTPSIEKIAAEDRPRVQAAIREVFEHGSSSVEARMLHRDGTTRWHLLTGNRVEIEGRRCLVGIGVDIAARRAAEEELAETSTRLELAASAGNLGIWAWDLRTDEAWVSPIYKQQLGYANHEYPMGYEQWAKTVHPDDLAATEQALKNLLESKRSDYEREYRMLHRDGTYRWINTRAHLYRDAEGQPVRMVGCHLDTTERRAMEEALRASREELRALGEHQHSVREEESRRIARELHDEIGAALTALKLDLGWVDRRMAEANCPQAEPVRERVQGISRQVDEAVAGLRRMCSALRPAVLDQLGLAEAIAWQCAEFEQRTGVACHVECDETLALDDARASAVFRILQELLTNVSRHAQATEVTVRAYCEEIDFFLSVADNGSGLPEEALRRRDRFGLAGVRERVRAAAGTVKFSPTPGGGTTVDVHLPGSCHNGPGSCDHETTS